MGVRLPENFWDHDGPFSWILLMLMVLNSTMVGLLYTVIAVMTNEYPELLDINTAQANLVGSVLLGTFLATVPINALLVSTFSLRICSGVGSVLAIAGVLSSAFAFKLWFLIVGFSLFAGYGVSMLWTATIKIVPHYFKKRQKMAYMATGIGYGMGRAIFPFIIEAILEKTTYKNTMLYTTIFFGLSLTAPIFYREQLPKEKPKSAKSLIKSYTHPLRRYIAPFHLANGYLWNAELTGVAVILFTYIDHTTEGERVAATVQTINGVAQMVGAIGLTLLLMKVKLNHYILQIVFNLLIGCVCFLIGAYRNVYSFYVSAGVLGFMEAIMVGNITCVCHHLYPEKDVVYAFGFHETMGGIAGFVAPYTAGLLQEKFGFPVGFYYLGCNSILGGVVFIIAGLGRKSTWKHRPVESEEPSPTDTEASTGEPEKKSASDIDDSSPPLEISPNDVKFVESNGHTSTAEDTDSSADKTAADNPTYIHDTTKL